MSDSSSQPQIDAGSLSEQARRYLSHVAPYSRLWIDDDLFAQIGEAMMVESSRYRHVTIDSLYVIRYKTIEVRPRLSWPFSRTQR